MIAGLTGVDHREIEHIAGGERFDGKDLPILLCLEDDAIAHNMGRRQELPGSVDIEPRAGAHGFGPVDHQIPIQSGQARRGGEFGGGGMQLTQHIQQNQLRDVHGRVGETSQRS